MYRIPVLALMCALIFVTGCQKQNENSQKSDSNAPAEVTKRFCYIARIGSLAEIPNEVWGTTEEPETVPEPETTSKNLKNKGVHSESVTVERPNTSTSVSEELDPEFLAIVESAAKETTTNEGIQAGNQKKDDLDFSIEMVESDDSETPKSVGSKEGADAPNAPSAPNVPAAADADGEEVVEISMQNDGKTDENTAAKKSRKTKKTGTPDSGSSVKTEGETAEAAETATDTATDSAAETASEDAEDAENTQDTETGEMTNDAASDDAASDDETSDDEMSEVSEGSEENADGTSNGSGTSVGLEEKMTRDVERLDEELERQAKEYLKIVQDVSDEMSAEIKAAHFQNVSIRVVKLPGSLVLGRTGHEYYVVRTMEYVGSNLSEDFNRLILSPNYVKWIQKQEKYLDLISLDEFNHEYWVEVPEFWVSSAKDVPAE